MFPYRPKRSYDLPKTRSYSLWVLMSIYYKVNVAGTSSYTVLIGQFYIQEPLCSFFCAQDLLLHCKSDVFRKFFQHLSGPLTLVGQHLEFGLTFWQNHLVRAQNTPATPCTNVQGVEGCMYCLPVRCHRVYWKVRRVLRFHYHQQTKPTSSTKVKPWW